MAGVNWDGLALFAASFLAGIVGYLVAGPFGFFVALIGAMFVGFPLKSVYDERRSRIAALEDRVADLESTVERLDTGTDADD